MRPWPGMIFLNTGSTAENLTSQIPILIEFIVEKFSRNTAINGTVAVKSFVIERFLRLEKKKKNHNIFAFGFDPVEKRKLGRERRADGKGWTWKTILGDLTNATLGGKPLSDYGLSGYGLTINKNISN